MSNHARITGLGTPPLPRNFNPAMAAGYAIVDRQGNLMLFSCAPNRSRAWDQFCKPAMKRTWQRAGFKCVPVTIKEYERR